MIKVRNKRTYSKTIRNRKGSPVLPKATNPTKPEKTEEKNEEKPLEFPPVSIESVGVLESAIETLSVSDEETEKPKKGKKQPKQHKQEESEE